MGFSSYQRLIKYNMATVDTTFLRQRSFPKLEIGKKLKEFVEYSACSGKPESSEANWIPVDWFGAKIEGILKKRGERV